MERPQDPIERRDVYMHCRREDVSISYAVGRLSLPTFRSAPSQDVSLFQSWHGITPW